MAGSRGVCRSLYRAHPSSFHAYWFAKQTSPLDASREILFLQLKLTLQWAGLREGTTLLKALPAHPWMSISLLAGTRLCQGSCPAMLQSGTAPRNRIPMKGRLSPAATRPCHHFPLVSGGSSEEIPSVLIFHNTATGWALSRQPWEGSSFQLLAQ